MRGLYTLHNIQNSSLNMWEEEGFVSFFVCSPAEEGYISALKSAWPYFDARSGNSLWVALTFDREGPNLDDEEMVRAAQLIEFLKLSSDQMPCLLFAQGPDSGNYFIYSLGRDADQRIATRELDAVIDACKRHMPTEKNGRTEHGFNALKQELRAMKFGRLFDWTHKEAGEMLRAAIVALVTGATI